MPEPTVGVDPQVSQKYLPTTHIQRLCATCKDDLQRRAQTRPPLMNRVGNGDDKALQGKLKGSIAPTPSSASTAQIRSIRSQGKPLPASDRAFFEPRFGADFSRVRIHDNTIAAEMAQGIGARAFTVGTDLVFGTGEYSPGTDTGKKLLAHELTHVTQRDRDNQTIIRREPDGETRKLVSKEDIANIVGLHIIDYREQVKSGINNWSPPKAEDSPIWFMISLAGNLAWAATSFINPAAAVAIRAMSLAGSVIGSGTLEKAFKSEAKAPDIKAQLVLQVSAYADKLKSDIRGTVDTIYSTLAYADVFQPLLGLMDADRNIDFRRHLAWGALFDESVAPWNNSTAIIVNTTKDVGDLWKRFKILYDAVILSIYDYPRYKGEKLKEKVDTIYYQAFVDSGVAERSVAVKKTFVWRQWGTILREVKVYEFPAPSPGMTGARVRQFTGRTAIPVEVE